MTGLFGLVIEMKNPIPEFNDFMNNYGENNVQKVYIDITNKELPLNMREDLQLYRS